MNYVLDAAVAIKWFVDEPLRPMALRLLDGRLGLHAPELILMEMGEIARRKLRRDEMTLEQAERALSQGPSFFECLHPAHELHERALQLSLALDRPVSEGFYLAIADRLKAPLVTTNRELVALQSDSLSIIHLSTLHALAA
jgi:predicted nucleic acid-binding protein